MGQLLIGRATHYSKFLRPYLKNYVFIVKQNRPLRESTGIIKIEGIKSLNGNKIILNSIRDEYF